jgi:hypothetical protein
MTKAKIILDNLTDDEAWPSLSRPLCRWQETLSNYGWHETEWGL